VGRNQVGSVSLVGKIGLASTVSINCPSCSNEFFIILFGVIIDVACVAHKCPHCLKWVRVIWEPLKCLACNDAAILDKLKSPCNLKTLEWKFMRDKNEIFS
jgi:hypothetical protein